MVRRTTKEEVNVEKPKLKKKKKRLEYDIKIAEEQGVSMK